jgi:hypothetical protein
MHAESDEPDLLAEELAVRRRAGIELAENPPAARGGIGAGTIVLQAGPGTDRGLPVLVLGRLDISGGDKPEAA